MHIETNRLTVKNMTLNNADELFAVLSDKDVMRFIEKPFSYKQTEDFIINFALCVPPKIFGVFLKETDLLIGHLIFHPYDETCYEVGWILNKLYWNMGFAQELTESVIDYAKQNKIKGLVIECDKNQLATRHIAEKHNFQLVEECSNSKLVEYKLKLD